jgi:hypothetical protein
MVADGIPGSSWVAWQEKKKGPGINVGLPVMDCQCVPITVSPDTFVSSCIQTTPKHLQAFRKKTLRGLGRVSVRLNHNS